MPLTAGVTDTALLIVQALHLHISFAEVFSAFRVCVPPIVPVAPALLMGAHI
jgi:hypothetical protein